MAKKVIGVPFYATQCFHQLLVRNVRDNYFLHQKALVSSKELPFSKKLKKL